jgi:hypothetical protein
MITKALKHDRRANAGREGTTHAHRVPGAPGGDDTPANGPSSLIDEIVRDGARRMLAGALQAEVDAYIDRFSDERTRAAIGSWSVTATTSRAMC